MVTTIKRRRMVQKSRPTLVCAILDGMMISSKNINEQSLEKLRVSWGIKTSSYASKA
jgi:hypothetical protein